MKIVYTFFIKLPLIALVTHTSRLRSLAAPARTCAPGSACSSQSRPRISTEASRRDRRCESVPFPLASRFPFRMMRATEDRRRIWGPIAKVHGEVQAEGCRALQKVRDDLRGGGARAGLRRRKPVRPGQEGRRGRLRAGDDPFQMAADLRRLKRENERLKREDGMLLKASALFAGRQL